jgi:D-amino-acid dehydrogenase
VSAYRCEVAVVGGGLVGAAAAYELACLGADVVLIDADHPGRATDAGAGILSPQTTWHPDERWFSFGLAAGAHYRSLVERLEREGVEDSGFCESGLLLVALEESEDDSFARRAELAMSRSPKVLEEVTADEARDLFPPLASVRHAIYNPVAARVDGRSVRVAVLRGAEKHGVRRLVSVVNDLRSHDGRVLAVETDSGQVSCDDLVIAGGAWSSAFASHLAVNIPVVPVKGQIVHMQLPPGEPGSRPDTGNWPVVSPVLNHYLVAWPEGRVACGGTFEPDAGYDVRPTIAGLEELLRACLAIAPGLAGASVIDHRVGLRPVSADFLPVVGPVPGWRNVHVVTGHGTEGLLLGPYSAAIVARHLRGDDVGDELDQFSLGRFNP